MEDHRPRVYLTADEAADDIMARVGARIVLGLPLGIGKANHIANALYRRVAADPALSLTIYSAVSLGIPRVGSSLKSRFVGPLVARLNAGHEPLDYVTALAGDGLPENIEVREFFLPAGAHLGNATIQQSYLSANYTHVVDRLLEAGVNVLAPLVARAEDGRLSLSSNPDLTLDFVRRHHDRGVATPLVVAAQVNEVLPFMEGEAVVRPAFFDGLLDTPETQFDLFAVPRQPVSLADYATAMRVAAMIPDGGTLQIGIGSFADALTHALLLRHRHPARFSELLDALGGAGAHLTTHRAPFAVGLYGASEMLVEGLVALMDAGVIARGADAFRDHAGADASDENIDDGPLIHAGFFLGAESFYQRLRDMSPQTRGRIAMMPISFVNELLGDEETKRGQRRDARFVNTGLMASLFGAVTSDGLADGQVISGVGGQYNFVAQALELHGARSIITIKAARGYGDKATS
ncbi:MAG: acetyl-CoA hydrolase/transferase C-terminal domain-containing protein, partial [Pseudomonadota bacterium]